MMSVSILIDYLKQLRFVKFLKTRALLVFKQVILLTNKTSFLADLDGA